MPLTRDYRQARRSSALCLIAPELVAFQLFAMSAQSRARGNVLINPGAFSLYRADLIREIVPAYLDETFFGCPVTPGDDTALAKCLGPAQPARTGR